MGWNKPRRWYNEIQILTTATPENVAPKATFFFLPMAEEKKAFTAPYNGHTQVVPSHTRSYHVIPESYQGRTKSRHVVHRIHGWKNPCFLSASEMLFCPPPPPPPRRGSANEMRGSDRSLVPEQTAPVPFAPGRPNSGRLKHSVLAVGWIPPPFFFFGSENAWSERYPVLLCCIVAQGSTSQVVQQQ